MYDWFVEPGVGVLVGREEEEEEVLLYVSVEVEGDEVVLYFPVAEDVGIVYPVPEDAQPEMLFDGLDPDPDPDPNGLLVDATPVSVAVIGHQVTVS